MEFKIKYPLKKNLFLWQLELKSTHCSILHINIRKDTNICLVFYLVQKKTNRHEKPVNCTGGIIVSVLVLRVAAVHGFKTWLGHIKDYKIGICFFSAKWRDMSIQHSVLIYNKADNIIISLKQLVLAMNIFSHGIKQQSLTHSKVCNSNKNICPRLLIFTLYF
jgi:hypothetical protein